ncbi:hypothetical protein [Sinorhizobium meliloti]|uniref:hypothetical protein n=1 Tax=Rhizobium meliloti TaxID=382 RepID=UPI003D65B75B
MANEATNEPTNEAVSAWDLLTRYKKPPQKPKNATVEAFSADIKKIETAIADKKTEGKGRWLVRVLKGTDTYEVKVLGEKFYVPKGEMSALLSDLKAAAEDENDTKFRRKIEKHYANKSSEGAVEQTSGPRVGNG